MTHLHHEGGEERFTAAEVQAALTAANYSTDEAALVGVVLAKFAAGRKEATMQAERLGDISMLCIAQQRIDGPPGSDEPNFSNIEEWYQRQNEAAIKVLYRTGEDLEAGRKLSELEQLAAKAAALVQVTYKYELPDIDLELLTKAGIEESWVVARFKRGLHIAYDSENDSTTSGLIEACTSIEELKKYDLNGAPDPVVVAEALIKDLAYALEEQGIVLPQLGEDGLYDDEREKF